MNKWEVIVENNEKAQEKIREAMELVHKNINLIISKKQMERIDTAILEDLMNSEKALLDRSVYLRGVNDRVKRYIKKEIGTSI